MPIYEYKCKKCNTIFEAIIFNSSQNTIKCEKCGSNEVDKLISATGLKISKETAIPLSSACQPRGGFT